MAIELKVPSPGESISEVIIANWLKKVGDSVAADEPIVEIDSEKATLEITAPSAGVISKLLKKEGETANVGEVIAIIDTNGKSVPAKAEPATAKTGARPARQSLGDGGSASDGSSSAKEKQSQPAADSPKVMPSARHMAAQKGIDPSTVTPTGPGGRVLKEDVQKAAAPKAAAQPSANSGGARETESVRMTTLRKRIAQRLVQAQQTAAILTTFNEIDMAPVMALRAEHKEAFLKRYEVKLGFMSFFVKAVVDALKLVPQVNAKIDGDNIVYHNYADIGVAVGGGKGLVVPVIRNAERLSFAEIEQTINDFGRRAQAGEIMPDEMQGGTFTISNGGVYGSLLSTPIINPPQSGILGMHNIVDRPVAVDGQVVIRPMMYVALSYDHRIVDGREAVTFLKRIKDCVETPTRMLMEV